MSSVSTPAPLCSNCFLNSGLRLDAYKIGLDDSIPCPRCGTTDGRKLDMNRVANLAHRFFVRGSIQRLEYGAFPRIQYNPQRYGSRERVVEDDQLQRDAALLEDTLKIGFFPYGPRLWMVGEVEPLKDLQDPSKRPAVIQRVLDEYPGRILGTDEQFFRVRRSPRNPSNSGEYDSPPAGVNGQGRLDSPGTPILYGSQFLEICIHECRVTAEDETFIATMRPTRPLRLLDVSALLPEQGVTEFESLDMAVHMLFLAGPHSYDVTRAIASAAQAVGFDGLVYPSYFSLVHTGAFPFETAYGISVRRFPSAQPWAQAQSIPNLAVFGRPVSTGLVAVDCVNRVLVERATYDLVFGPVLDP